VVVVFLISRQIGSKSKVRSGQGGRYICFRELG